MLSIQSLPLFLLFAVTEWPDVWTVQVAREKKQSYPWLMASGGFIGCKYCKECPIPSMEQKSGSVPSREWVSCKVGFSKNDPKSRSTKLTMFRNKIAVHRKSAAHLASEAVFNRKLSLSKTQELLADQYTKHQNSTEKIFRVAYNIGKMNRPYTDLPHHIDCYKANGVDMGNILHTDKSCAAIIKSISADMKSKLLCSMLNSDSKFSVLIDESTTVSGKAALVVHLRACVQNKSTTFFLDIIHLLATDARSIVNALVSTLSSHGLKREQLDKNFVCFASDGASVMTGVKSGVGALLLEMFPSLLLWHCANHRLELAVSDAVGEVAGSNSFKMVMDSLYSLYSQSPKLQQELAECASEVDGELRKIGRVLDTRWSASSLRTVKAVWTSYGSLVANFRSKVGTKDSAKFNGLLNIISSPNFILNLAIMYDALVEISHLSLLLQSRDMTLICAHKLMDQCIKAMQGMASTPGKMQQMALDAVDNGEFKGVVLSTAKVVAIRSGQFFQSLANSLRARLLTVRSRKGEKATVAENNAAEYTELLHQVSLLDYTTWPTNYENIPSFGESELAKLCHRLRVECEETISGFKLFKAVGGRQVNPMLSNIRLAIACIPVSTAECERAFSLMNTILSSRRNRLDLENVSSLMFMSILGPPVHIFDPAPYVKHWLRQGKHAANDTQSVKRNTPDVSGDYYSHVYKLL